MADNSTLTDLIQELAEERGVDLRGYKIPTLERRVNRRMQQLGLHSYDEYLSYIRTKPAENNDLLNTVLINVTRFFRDPPAWQVLEESVLPALFKDRPQEARFAYGARDAPPVKKPIPSPFCCSTFWERGSRNLISRSTPRTMMTKRST